MSSKSILAAAAAIALSLSAPAAQAQDVSAQSLNDLTCFAAFAAAYGNTEAQLSADQRQAIATGITYYLGRLEGRDPQTDWLGYLNSHEQEVYARVLIDTEFNRCIAEFTSVGARMVAASS